MSNIHPTAVIHQNVEMGKNITIGPYAIIEQNVTIGDGTRIDAFAQIKSHTIIGKNNHIHSYACIGGEPQDLKYKGAPTKLYIGDNNIIREFVTIHRGTEEGGGITKIGSECLMMAYVHIAHDCIIGNRVIMANAATLGGHVVIEDNAVIGGLSAVHQFVRIGKFAYIGGMTGVSQDVPPYSLIAGERGKMYGLNLVGLKRHGFSKDKVEMLKKAYKLIWRSGLRREEAIDRILNELGDCPEVVCLVKFVEKSQRGIVPPSKVKK